MIDFFKAGLLFFFTISILFLGCKKKGKLEISPAYPVKTAKDSAYNIKGKWACKGINYVQGYYLDSTHFGDSTFEIHSIVNISAPDSSLTVGASTYGYNQRFYYTYMGSGNFKFDRLDTIRKVLLFTFDDYHTNFGYGGALYYYYMADSIEFSYTYDYRGVGGYEVILGGKRQ